MEKLPIGRTSGILLLCCSVLFVSVVSANEIIEHAVGQEPKLVVLEKQKRNAYEKKELDRLSLEKTETHPVTGYLAHPEIVGLFSAMELRFTENGVVKEIPFRFHLPEKTPLGKRFPLIVFFHGEGESDDDNTRQLSHIQYAVNSFVGPQKFDCFILAAQCPADNHSWNSSENKYGTSPLTYVELMIRAVIREYPIDVERVSAFGICSGATAAWRCAAKNPELFCALGLCSPVIDYYDSGIDVLRNVPVWFFGNNQDRAFPLENMRRTFDVMNQKGIRLYYSERNGTHDSWSKALRDDLIFNWLLSQKKGNDGPPPGVVVRARRSWREAFFATILPVLIILTLTFNRRINRIKTIRKELP